MHTLILLAALGFASTSSSAQSTETISPPGQPVHTGIPGQFEIIGNSLVSGQQVFLGTENNVYIVDKTEDNPTRIRGHPAWASEWTLDSNSQRPMDALTNAFCAGGNVLGNGTWVNVGGNQAVTYGGDPAESQFGGGPYDDPDGRRSIRLLNPCDGATCDWLLSPMSSEQRWYPTVETLEDGTLIILGGCRNGGYVNDKYQDNPTYQFFPPAKGDGPIASPVLQRTLPANLYPLTWLLPSGRLLVQSNWETVLLDYRQNKEIPLDNVPDAVRTYPASAGTIMLPLTPANNWTATILFCGGSDVQPNRWLSPSFIVPELPASTSCVKITPDRSRSYVKDDPLPEGRSMANLVFLPDGRILCLNGAKMGTAGYGNQSWAIGQSYADAPVLTPVIYDPNASSGHRWSGDGLSASTVPRMYHSAAILLPDGKRIPPPDVKKAFNVSNTLSASIPSGSVFVTGSNPNSDYNVAKNVKYKTEYRTERFYPLYYNERRPQPRGLLKQLSYGGPAFDVFLDSDDLFGDVDNVQNASVVIIRPGFSTHAINMGQRYLQLENTFTAYRTNSTAVLHVSQVPPNPSILAPGPALLFVTVKGVPSVGVQVMVGSGQLGKQPVLAIGDLPASEFIGSGGDLGRTSGTSSIRSPSPLTCGLFSCLWLAVRLLW